VFAGLPKAPVANKVRAAGNQAVAPVKVRAVAGVAIENAVLAEDLTNYVDVRIVC